MSEVLIGMEPKEAVVRQFDTVFQQDGLERAEERTVLLRAFLDRGGYVSPKDMWDEIGKGFPALDESAIAQMLGQFVRYGLAHEIRGEDGQVRYEPRSLDRRHEHVICVRCGRIADVECDLPGLRRRVSRQVGYHALHVHLQIHGLCPDCLAERRATFPLARATSGERVRIVEVTGADELSARLSDMGLCRGVEVEVVDADRGGSVVVLVGQTRLGLGTEVASSVRVQHADAAEAPQPIQPAPAGPPPPRRRGRRWRWGWS